LKLAELQQEYLPRLEKYENQLRLKTGTVTARPIPMPVRSIKTGLQSPNQHGHRHQRNGRAITTPKDVRVIGYEFMEQLGCGATKPVYNKKQTILYVPWGR
jgi:hypothetical protein